MAFGPLAMPKGCPTWLRLTSRIYKLFTKPEPFSTASSLFKHHLPPYLGVLSTPRYCNNKDTNMPTPIEIFTDPLSLFFVALYAALMLWETVFPAKELPRVKNWHLKGIASFIVYFLIASYIPLFIDGKLAEYQLIDLSHLSQGAGIAIGVLGYHLGAYWYHRLIHSSNFLWRTTHQWHHSAERLDIAGAFYLSPFDMVGWTVVGSLILALGIGIPASSATAVMTIIFFLGTFTHLNVKTPHWLGYIIERPESHSLHHARGAHRYNYSEIPLFDMLFGTFRNPKEFVAETGFYQGGSERMLAMLFGIDISRSPRKLKTAPRTNSQQQEVN